VDGDACTVLVDEAWIPSDIDMAFSVIKSIKNSSAAFSAMLNAFDIHTRGEQFRHGNEIESESTMINV